MTLVLLADDDKAIRLVISTALSHAGYDVKTAATLADLTGFLSHSEASVLVSDVVFPDGDALDLLPDIKARYPDMAIIMMSARSTLLTAVKAQELEVASYLPKPFPLETLIAAVDSALTNKGALTNAGGDEDTAAAPNEEQGGLIGRSPAMQDIFRSMARLVSTDLSVIINGESGTGKEVVARALHNLGGRRRQPFVALNMAAIPHDLIESELFGHEKGAFTGADRRADGHFSQAQGGTLFLDEIGDMPPNAQTRLLRVLQDGSYTRVGGRESIRSDARIIAATHQHLTDLIARGQFREDLYYRLNVVPLNLPPLRDRAEDIPALTHHFIKRAKAEGLAAKSISKESMALLMGHRWPGNVRELENLIRRLLVLVDDGAIEPHHLLPMLAQSPDNRSESGNLSASVAHHINIFFDAHAGDMPRSGLYRLILDEVERPLIERTLQATRGNQLKAAEILGLNRNTLRKKITLLGITAGRFS